MPTTRTLPPPKIERRLAAIMVADVAGYSRLMGTDEVGTLSALKEHRRDRIDPTIARHNGRIFKATGDGLLVEFASVVDAVGCGVAIQRAMLAFNEGIHADRQIVLRIGINVGDIIIDGADIFGDGVNVAARLEALCEPGGVCISRSANEQVRDKLSLTFADLGEQTVKNIARSVGVFGLAAKDIAALPEEAVPQPGLRAWPTASHRFTRKVLTTICSGIVVALLGAGGWWVLHDKITFALAPASPARPVAYSPEDRRLSVIVLPFENTSGDPSQDHLAASITHDVTNSVSGDRTVPLVPEQTAMAYRGKPLDLHAVQQAHNVHFAITGTVHRENAHLIVSVTMFDTKDSRPVWAQLFHKNDNRDEYDRIIHAIGAGFHQAATDAEAMHANQEHPNELDKRDLMIASEVSSLLQGTKDHFQAKIELVERALALDPNFVWALQSSASLSADSILSGYSADPKAESARALARIDRALERAPNDYETLKQKVRVLRIEGDIDGAEAITRELIRMNPLSAYRYWNLGIIRLIQGHPDEMLTNMQTARRLAGSDDDQVTLDVYLALALLANGRLAEAISQGRLAAAESPTESRNGDIAGMMLIAAEHLNGNVEQAKVDLQHFLATPRTLSTLKMVQTAPSLANIPKLVDALRQVGMPEQ
jgi:adenylate cyclase